MKDGCLKNFMCIIVLNRINFEMSSIFLFFFGETKFKGLNVPALPKHSFKSCSTENGLCKPFYKLIFKKGENKTKICIYETESSYIRIGGNSVAGYTNHFFDDAEILL